MSQEGYIEAFRTWIRRNESRLNASGIAVQVSEKIIPSGTYAEFFSEIGEATVEVWDYGFNEFHIVDLRAADLESDYQVTVTHHEFQSESELFGALDDLVRQLSPAQEQMSVSRKHSAAGLV